MRKTGNRTCRVIGTEQALFTEDKIGEPMVPLEGQNFIIKGRVRLRRQSSEKERKKRFLEKRTISKVVVKRKKTLREK